MQCMSFQDNFDQGKQDKLAHTELYTAIDCFQDKSLLKVSEHYTVQIASMLSLAFVYKLAVLLVEKRKAGIQKNTDFFPLKTKNMFC